MALNDNESFYRKLLGGIVVFCCLVFVIALNVMRYEQLYAATPPIQKEHLKKGTYFFSVSFVPLEKKDNPRMIFLSGTENKSYFSSVFSFLDENKPQHVTLVNCAKNDATQLKEFLKKNNTVYEEVCDIDEATLQTMLESGYTLFVFNLDKTLKHAAALRVAERLKLKPDLKITEIKNANKRL